MSSPAPTSPPGPPPSNGTSPPAETPPLPATPSAPPPPQESGGVPPAPGSTPPPPRTPSSPAPGFTPGGTLLSSSPLFHSESSGLKSGGVAGIAVGGVVALLLGCLLCVCLSKKRKERKKRQHPPPPPLHYGHPPPPHIGDQYGGTYQNWQQNAPPPPPPPDHVVNVHAHPPPPPPLHAHSSGSASNNSGSEGGRRPPLTPAASYAFSRSATFTYEELAAATDGFSDANLLGQGGFGYVHKGVLPNGKEVAVKQLRDGSGQGEREFQAEVEIISRVHHRHLVSLVGYCISGGDKRLLLVYEFVPNNTLEFHLHGSGRPTMDWPTRLKIALGSAKGLAYLHEDCYPKIIHRDIKAANILLDLRFEAKVADFGLAKLTSDTNTHVSTRVMGTFGYLAPEYASSGKLTEKSDVFSFGIMLLEFITGRRPGQILPLILLIPRLQYDHSLRQPRPLMTKALEDGNLDALVDPRLGYEYNNYEMEKMIACAAACVRHFARRRPRMSQVVRALEGGVSLDDLKEGAGSGLSWVMGSNSSSDYDAGQYNEDLKKFKKMALDSRGLQRSQQTPTSEYSQNPSVWSSDGHQTQETETQSVKKDGDSQSYS